MSVDARAGEDEEALKVVDQCIELNPTSKSRELRIAIVSALKAKAETASASGASDIAPPQTTSTTTAAVVIPVPSAPAIHPSRLSRVAFEVNTALVVPPPPPVRAVVAAASVTTAASANSSSSIAPATNAILTQALNHIKADTTRWIEEFRVSYKSMFQKLRTEWEQELQNNAGVALL